MLSQHAHRKDEHVSLAEYFYNSDRTRFFDQVRFIHQSFPECAYSDIDPRTHIGPIKLKWPFYIEAMTGGSPETGKLNARLSRIAKVTGLAMASGSQSVALTDPKLSPTFQVIRKNDPHGIVFANVGVNRTVPQALRAIKMLHADALEVHVNAPQELIMPEGARTFHWLQNVKALVKNIPVPVIIKEVGFGMAQETIQQLAQRGVKYINISGRGGTNFAKIENFRRHRQDLSYLHAWGQTTVESLFEARPFEPQMTVMASGGIKNALDIAKALALGANAVGIAGQILHTLIQNGERATIQMIQDWQRGLKIIMAMLGCRNLKELQKQKLLLSPNLISYLKQRNLKY